MPGGGGLLIFEAKDYLTAKIIENDPMIKNNLVIWDLQNGYQLMKSTEFFKSPWMRHH